MLFYDYPKLYVYVIRFLAFVLVLIFGVIWLAVIMP